MIENGGATGRRAYCVRMLAGLSLGLMMCAAGVSAQTKDTEQKPADAKYEYGNYQTFYLTDPPEARVANDIQTDLRNMVPKARIYYEASRNAISVRGSADDIQLAQKVLAEIDAPRKTCRLTYTITDTDNGKRVGTKSFALIVTHGEKTVLKQGIKVPIVTGMADKESSGQESQVQYEDVGLEIEASLDGVKLSTRVVQSSLADEKPGVSAKDPVFRQTVLDLVATLEPGKPLVLGSIDVAGSTRHEEIAVVSEVVQ